MKEGKLVYGTITENTLEPSFEFLGPALMNFYADFGTGRLFFSIIEENLIIYNSYGVMLIKGCQMRL